MENQKSVNLDTVFGEVLREIRQQQNLSQEQLGFRSGYHRTYIGLLERGLKNPTLDAIFALAKALNVSPVAIVQQVELKAKHATKEAS